jgi:hypothetical protein
MLKKVTITLFVAVSLLVTGSALLPAQAQAATADNCGKQSNNFLSFPTWYKYLNPVFQDGECKVSFPKDSEGNESIVMAVGPILLAVFEIILRIGGLAAVGFVIFGGYQYLLSQGEPESTKGAKSTILNAVIGLAIMMSAVAIVNLIGRNIS